MNRHALRLQLKDDCEHDESYRACSNEFAFLDNNGEEVSWWISCVLCSSGCSMCVDGDCVTTAPETVDPVMYIST